MTPVTPVPAADPAMLSSSSLAPIPREGGGIVPTTLAPLLTRLRDLGLQEDANWWIAHLHKYPEDDPADVAKHLRRLIAKHEPKGQ